jgi:aromatic ring-cleaving dioxygenase
MPTSARQFSTAIFSIIRIDKIDQMLKKTPKKIPMNAAANKNAPKKNGLARKSSKKAAEVAAASNPRKIREYHAHIYYDPQNTRGRAARLRERVAVEFPHARLGRWHDELVGPHTQSMYQIAFASDMLAAFLPWLMLNRDGLTVLLHPETGNDYRDHTAHAAWLGGALPLRLEAFGEQQPDE